MNAFKRSFNVFFGGGLIDHAVHEGMRQILPYSLVTLIVLIFSSWLTFYLESLLPIYLAIGFFVVMGVASYAFANRWPSYSAWDGLETGTVYVYTAGCMLISHDPLLDFFFLIVAAGIIPGIATQRGLNYYIGSAYSLVPIAYWLRHPDQSALAFAFLLCGVASYYIFSRSTEVRIRGNQAKISGAQTKFDFISRYSNDFLFRTSVSGEILLASPAAMNVFGLEPEKNIQQSIFNLIVQEDADAFSQAWLNLSETSKTVHVHRIRLKKKTLETIWVRAELHHRTTTDQDWIEIAMRDVTHIVQLENKLATQNLDIIRRLSGDIAHDFNNLLAIIKGHSDAISSHPNDVHTHTDAIAKASNQAKSLTQQLLALAGEQFAELEPHNVNNLIENQITQLRSLFDHRIAFVVELDEDLPPVALDFRQMDQVLLNILSNAIDALDNRQDGEIRITTKIAEDQTRLHIEIEDNGIGLDGRSADHLFQPYVSTKEGTHKGLGLAVAKGVMRQHNGNISLSPNTTGGVTVLLDLPIDVMDQQVVEQEVSIPEDRERNVMIVDDNAMLTDLIALILSDLPKTQLHFARNGEDALRKMRDLSVIDLLVTDIRMPRMSGRELAAEVWRTVPETPVVFVSGFAKDQIEKDLVNGHNYRFLRKPFSNDSLLETVTELLRAPTQQQPDSPRL